MDHQTVSSIVWIWAVFLGSLTLVALMMQSHRGSSSQALLPYPSLRGWQNVIRASESIVPWTKPQGLWTSGSNVAGIWKGRRAEIASFDLHEAHLRTMAAVACAQVPPGLGWVTAMDPKYPYATGKKAGSTQRSQLGQRFLMSGEDRDLAAIFSADVEKAILGFPSRINQIMFDGNAISVTWYGCEEDPAVVDAALDLAVVIAHQVETAAAQAGG